MAMVGYNVPGQAPMGGTYVGGMVPAVGGAYGGGMVGAMGGAYGGSAAAGGAAGGDGACGVGGGGDCGANAGCGAAADDATVMSHVGAGGDYKLKTTYEYVGSGLGDHDAVKVPSEVQGHYCGVWVTICLFLPVALLLLHALSSEGVNPTPAPPPPMVLPTPAPAPNVRATCTWWGDPHYWTFDDPQHRHEEDQYENHDYWIIKTAQVWVQGRYRPTEWLKHRGNHRACMAGVCFGGPFMQGNNFCVMSLNRAIYYNKLKVLTTHGTFSQGPVQATYNSLGSPMDPRMGGGKMQLNIVKITLPHGVSVQVDRWKEHIDGQITMSSAEARSGMEGHCGNFDGSIANDVNTQLSSFGEHNSKFSKRVTARECLFPTHPHFHDPLSGKLEPGSTFAKEILN